MHGSRYNSPMKVRVGTISWGAFPKPPIYLPVSPRRTSEPAMLYVASHHISMPRE
ncbi:uncharacterized protein LY79DRAFT_564597 [Colletotrichum navitas]|uniref:Uncharacterized protein n=1 Tax=Colletotrichum navitas TaxID=681940 RepID=A0AAD8V246_9PEZI|nr:uncharacterized protein LY79DRAFT_564597 [Colletotrichum navitas]KAK1579339.1 hypothetical protein LY79DRAFT_564597 [Colletotrichum navitas]